MAQDMISRRTMVTVLLALLLGLGIRVWAAGVRDDCDRMGPGTRGQPASVKVESGTRSIDVPCARWAWGLRQTRTVQALALLDGVLGLMVVVFALGDWSRWRERRPL